MKTYFKKDGYTTFYRINCKTCGEIFVSKANNALYCCEECRPKKQKQASRPKYHKICAECGIKYDGEKISKFCSSKCRSKYNNRKNPKIYNYKKVEYEPRKCPGCFEEFTPTTSRQIYCSKKCGKRVRGASESLLYDRSISSDRRLRNATQYDNTISLLALIKRDNNICAICNGVCDLYDYTIMSNGKISTGDKYPSIDHIKPISKGGLHKWDNIQLAHRICNREKSDKYNG